MDPVAMESESIGEVSDSMSASGNASSSKSADLDMDDLVRISSGQPRAPCSSPDSMGQIENVNSSICARETVEARREEVIMSSALQPNTAEESPSAAAIKSTAMGGITSVASSYSSHPTISESSSWKALDATPEDLVSSSSNSSSSGESSTRSGIHPHSIIHVSMLPLERTVSGLTTLAATTVATTTAIATKGSLNNHNSESDNSSGISDGFYAKLKAAANAVLPSSTASSSGLNTERPSQDGQNLQQLEDRVLSKRDIAGRLVLPQERHKIGGGNNKCSEEKQDSMTQSNGSTDGHQSHSSSSHRCLATTSSPLSLPVVQEQSILEEWNALHNNHRHRCHPSAVPVVRPGAYHQAPGQLAIRRARCRSLYPDEYSIDSASVSHEEVVRSIGRDDDDDDTSSPSGAVSHPSLTSEQNSCNDRTSNDSNDVAASFYNDEMVATYEYSCVFSVSSFSLQGYQEQQDHLPPDVMRMMDADIPPISGTAGFFRYTGEEAGTNGNENRRGGQEHDNDVQELWDEESVGSFSDSYAENRSNVGNFTRNQIDNQRNPGNPTTALANDDRLVEARPVQAQDTSNIVSADPVDENRQHSTFAKHVWYTRPLLWATLTCMIMFVGTILTVVVLGSTSDKSANHEDNSFSSQKSPPTTERGFLIQQKLEEYLGNDTFDAEDGASVLWVDLSDPKINATETNNGDASACRKALDWLVNSDERYLNHTSKNLLQRFVLAYFYHHTSKEAQWISCNPAQGQESNFCSYHYVGPLGEHYDESPFHIRWLSPEDECDWAGVYCNDLNQVDEISLNGYSLSGTFPAKISMLHNLTSLSLRDSQFVGQLPSELSALSNLKVLRLNRNGFIGSVPQQWQALTSLVHLDIAWNQLTGTLKLDSLSNLENLWIDHNHFSGSVPVSSLTNLRQLYLSHCDFVGSIPYLGQLTELQYLDASGNARISDALPTEIGLLTQLHDLVLSSTSFHGTLPMELYSLSQLQDLELDNCNFTGTLSPQIFHMVGLQNLVLAGNNFVGTLPTELGLLTELIHAELQDTGFVGTVPESMCLLKGPNTLKDLVTDCGAQLAAVAGEKANSGVVRPPIECPEGCCTSCCDAETKICLTT